MKGRFLAYSLDNRILGLFAFTIEILFPELCSRSNHARREILPVAYLSDRECPTPLSVWRARTGIHRHSPSSPRNRIQRQAIVIRISSDVERDHIRSLSSFRWLSDSRCLTDESLYCKPQHCHRRECAQRLPPFGCDLSFRRRRRVVAFEL